MKDSIIYFFIVTALIVACSADRSSTFKITGYNCGALERFELEGPLKEISGLAYHAQHNEFLAINDEHGTVFVLDPQTFNIKNKIYFAEKGDYEEIQLSNNSIYVLRSDGVIFKMKYDGKHISDIITFDYHGPKAEFESFYIESTGNKLILIPKNSKDAKINKITAGYTIDATTGAFISQEGFKIDWKKLKTVETFHPSGVAVQAQTKQIYVLASIEKLLLVLDTLGNIHAEYPLPASTFPQPEGIAFDEQNNLYISNEAEDVSPAIIKIPIQK